MEKSKSMNGIKSAFGPPGSIRITESGRTTLCFIIAVVNWFTILLSLTLTILGIYIKTSVQRFTNLIQDYDGDTLPYLLIGVGIISGIGNAVGGWLAFASANPDTRLKLRHTHFGYIIFTLVISVTVFAGGMMCFAQTSHLEKSFHGGIAAALTKYRDNIEFKKTVDLLQIEYSCCGNEDYADWFKVSWIHPDYLSTESAADMLIEAIGQPGGYISDDTPFSCCSPAAKRPCIHHKIQDNSAHVNYDFRDHVTLHTMGCRDALMDYFGDRLLTYGGFVITGVFFLQVLLVLVTRILQTSLSSAALSDDPTAPSYGYIIKCGAARPDAADREVLQPLIGYVEESPVMPTPTPSHLSQRSLSDTDSDQSDAQLRRGSDQSNVQLQRRTDQSSVQLQRRSDQSNVQLQRRVSTASRQGTQADLRRHSIMNRQKSAVNTKQRSSLAVRDHDTSSPRSTGPPPRPSTGPPPRPSTIPLPRPSTGRPPRPPPPCPLPPAPQQQPRPQHCDPAAVDNVSVSFDGWPSDEWDSPYEQ